MHECDSTGMKGYASVRIGTRRTVFEVTFYRTTEVRQLAADLMMTSGKKLHLDEPVTVRLSDLLIVELCQLGILSHSSLTAYI